jgi:regulator of sigma E protease
MWEEAMLTAISSIIIFSILIFVHELGHFIVARIFKVRVNEFALGMGPKLISRRKGETVYALRLLPIGGFCAMEGEDSAGSGKIEKINEDTKNPEYSDNIPATGDGGAAAVSGDSLLDKPYWQRAIIFFAGSFMNIVLTYLILFVLVLVAMIASGSFDIAFLFYRPVQLIGNLAGFMYEFLGQLFTGHANVEDVSGPVGIVSAVNTSVSQGPASLAFLASLISLNLAVVNLLPFPALDGGRIAFLVINKISGGRVSEKVESGFHIVGIALLLMLMVAITFKDVLKLL